MQYIHCAISDFNFSVKNCEKLKLKEIVQDIGKATE